MVTRGQKEHIRAFDKLPCWGSKVIPGARCATIREAPRVEAILKVAVPTVVVMDALRHCCPPVLVAVPTRHEASQRHWERLQ
jgi:hypothetical protein